MPERSLTTRDKNQSVVRCGDLVLAATGLSPISDESVDEFVAFASATKNVDGPIRGVFQYSPTQSPSAAQRKKFATIQVDEVYARVAVCSNSAIVRGAITAIAWLVKSGTETRAFTTQDWETALRWLHEKVKFDLTEGRAAFSMVLQNVGLPPPK